LLDRGEVLHADEARHLERAVHPLLAEFAVVDSFDDVAVELGGGDRLGDLVDLGDQLDRDLRGSAARRRNATPP
jgi:hypothetical protein